MASSPRVYNQTRSCYWKRNQAVKAVANCAAEWLEFNVVIRDLTLPESIAKRAEQKMPLQPQPLPRYELPNVLFRFSDYAAVIRECIHVFEANRTAKLPLHERTLKGWG